jgi:hypothetical protein
MPPQTQEGEMLLDQGQGQTQTSAQTPAQAPGQTPVTVVPGGAPAPAAAPTWDEFLTTLPAEHKALYEEHVGGLRRTVQATRSERDALQKSLADITTALGKDPAEAKRLLEETSAQLTVATQRAEFAEQAGRPEIGCTNPAAAFLVAKAQGLFSARGVPNWDAIREAVPELFRGKPTTPAGNAGAGTGTQPTVKRSMDEFIRAKAGVW